MPPLGAVRGGRRAGRLREHVAPSAQPERLIQMQGTEVTAACLIQPLPGAPTQQRTRGGDPTRAGISRLGHTVVKSGAGSKGQEEQDTCDPRAQAASRGQRETTHISHEGMVWADYSGAGAPPGWAPPQRGQDQGGS